MFLIVETDNYGGDYPNEKFVNLPPMSRKNAEGVADAINAAFPENYPRYWKVEEESYKLSPGFEP